MSCRAWLVVVCVAGCADDGGVITLEVPARATQATMLRAMTLDTEPEDSDYRWHVAVAPDDSNAVATGDSPSIAFTPDVRGTYVVERWMSYGLGEDLTHRFIVGALGLPPVAVARSSATIAVGQAIALDAADSYSAEGRTLAFTWRLALRPRSSAAELASIDAATTSFVADVAGVYAIELAAFDGELWSMPHASLTLSVAAP